MKQFQLDSRRGVTRLACAAGVASLLFLFFTALAIAQKKQPPAKPVDLNSASVVELQTIPGVGPATAEAIVNFREKSGRFKRVEDILAIRGISKQKLDAMRPYITVQPPGPD